MLTLEQFIEHMHEGVIVTDAERHILLVNASFCRVTGYSREESLGQNPKMLQSGRHSQEFYALMWNQLQKLGSWEGEIWNRRKSGEVYPEWLSIAVVKNEKQEITHYLAIFADITNRKLAEQRLKDLAHFDPLTGLPNRVLYHDRLHQALALARRRQDKVALLFIDLDQFKSVNDTLGHSVGDALLLKTAEVLKTCVREVDTVARVGGDEFTVILSGIAREEDASHVAQKILQAFSHPLVVAGISLRTTPSIGIALSTGEHEDIETLHSHADKAMYEVKRQGRNAYGFYKAG